MKKILILLTVALFSVASFSQAPVTPNAKPATKLSQSEINKKLGLPAGYKFDDFEDRFNNFTAKLYWWSQALQGNGDTSSSFIAYKISYSALIVEYPEVGVELEKRPFFQNLCYVSCSFLYYACLRYCPEVGCEKTCVSNWNSCSSFCSYIPI